MTQRVLRQWAMALLVGTMAMGMAACEGESEGPAEEAGEQVDDAMEEAGEAVEEMGEDIQESADESGY
ncbi:hypothetical protein LG302_17280 [Halomonas organivorans]